MVNPGSLITAIKENNLDKFKILFNEAKESQTAEKRIDLQYYISSSYYWSIKYNNYEILSYLLENNTRIPVYADTILLIAFELENTNMIKLLIKYGYNIEIYDILRKICSKNDDSFLQKYFDLGGSLDKCMKYIMSNCRELKRWVLDFYKNHEYNLREVLLTIIPRTTEIVEFLVNYATEYNCDKKKIFHNILTQKKIHLVKAALENGLEIPDDPETYYLIIRLSDFDIIQYLTVNGLNHSKYDCGELQYDLGKNKTLKTLSFLIENGFNIEKTWKNLCVSAVEEGDIELLKYLHSLNLDFGEISEECMLAATNHINLQFYKFFNELGFYSVNINEHINVLLEHFYDPLVSIEMLQYLIELGGIIKDDYLHYCLVYDSLSLFQLLVNNGVRLSSDTLADAIREGSIEIIKILLENDIRLEKKHGTKFMIYNNVTKIMELLSSYGIEIEYEYADDNDFYKCYSKRRHVNNVIGGTDLMWLHLGDLDMIKLNYNEKHKSQYLENAILFGYDNIIKFCEEN